MPKQVLFVCSRNAGRSQMAAAFFNVTADPERFRAISAGLEPADEVHPRVIDVMREVGIDLSMASPTLLTGRMQTDSLFLVTLGCGEKCPLFSPSRREDWSFPDPSDLPIAQVRKVRDDIRRAVVELVRTKDWGQRKPSSQ
jgi:arsenate reductase